MIKLGTDLDNVCSGSVTDQSLFYTKNQLLGSTPIHYEILTFRDLKVYASLGIVLDFVELSLLDQYILIGIRNEPS